MEKIISLFAVLLIFVTTAESQLFPHYGTLDAAVQHIVHPKAKPSTAMIELALDHLITPKHKNQLMEFIPHFIQLAKDMGVQANNTNGNNASAENLRNMILEKGMQWLKMRIQQEINGKAQQQQQMIRRMVIQTLLQLQRQTQEPVTLEDIFERLGLDIELPENYQQILMTMLRLGMGRRSNMGGPMSMGGPDMGGSTSMAGQNMEGPIISGAAMGGPMTMGGIDMAGHGFSADIGSLMALVENLVNPMTTGGSIMGGADMGGSIMGGADMGGSIMGGADMGGSIMGGADMGAPIMGEPIMDGADMGGSIMGGADMGGSIMGGAFIGEPIMGGADMGGPLMGGADMGGPIMGGADMGGPITMGGADMGNPNTNTL